MRIGAIIIGIILIGFGIWVALGNLHYNDTSTKAQLGPLKIEASKQKTVPAPVGYASIVIGGVLIVAGVMKKK